MENRCPDGRGCSGNRRRPDCEALVLVPGAPTALFAVAAPSAERGRFGALTTRRTKKPQCRGVGAGYWVPVPRRDPDRPLLMAGAPLKAEAWDFVRDDCDYHHFRDAEVRDCLAGRGTKVLALLGDSIVRDLYEGLVKRLRVDVDVDAIRAVRFGSADEAAALKAQAAATARAADTRVHYKQIWGLDDAYRTGLLSDDEICCGFEPRKRRASRGLDEDEAFGGAVDPGGEVLVVANLGLLHMDNSALNGNFEKVARAALGSLSRWADARRASLRVVLLGAPALLGLRNPGMHTDQLAAFVRVMADVAAESRANLNATVLDLAPLSLGRGDATADGLHFSGTVTQLAVDALLGLFCDPPLTV